MRIRHAAALSALLLISITIPAPPAAAELPEGWSWHYLRAGNTGVQGDYSSALWIDDDDLLYACCYVPQWEEGGFAHFIEAENRWENFSNVDYPVMGDRSVTGAARISDIEPDAAGGLWMGTWVGALYYDPAIGPDSFVRHDAQNSPMPGGRTMDVDIAPDGTVWFAIYGNGGGLVRHQPGTGDWTVWGYASSENGWPGWTTTEAAVVQPKPGGGYLVWIDDAFGRASFDSDTQQFTVLPNDQQAGDIMSVLTNGRDDHGNVWMLRYTTPGQLYNLEFRRPDGSWGAPSQPFGAIELKTFRAFGKEHALLIAGDDVYHYDSANWQNLGAWGGAGVFTYGLDMDGAGDVWVSGNGGVARRSAETGHWQRYRLSNTGLMDYWVRDFGFDAAGNAWVTSNGGPGTGGIARFDGQRWYNWNVRTYGLGGDWPYPCDNADAICYRPSSGHTAFNPTNNGIREWDGSSFLTLETGSTSDGLAEDSFGRLWTMGNYYSLRYHEGAGFVDVGIDGWGNNVCTDPSRPGTVWACANFEVVRTDGEDYRFSRETPDFPELNTMHDTLLGVVADEGGVAWVGTTEGFFRLDAESGTHEWWHSSNSSMPGDYVFPLAVTPDGRFWFSNFNSNGIEASLVWFDGSEFGTVMRTDGLPHAQIYDAEVRLVGDAYELWLSCASMGLAVLTVPFSEGTAVADNASDLQLLQGNPNPFTDRSAIHFSLRESGPAELTVYDLRGRRVRTLVAGSRAAGEHRAIWDGRDKAGQPVASGVYFVRLSAGDEIAQGRIVLLR